MQNLYLPIVILCTFLCNSPATAQEEGAPWVRYYDEMTAGEDDSEQLDEQTYEWLCQMAAQPIDLNTATREPRPPEDLGRADSHPLDGL